MAHEKFYVDLQRIQEGRCCQLGDIYWLVKSGQDAPEHARRLAAHVACNLEGYSPMVTLQAAMEELDEEKLDVGK